MLICKVVDGMLPTWSNINQSAGDSWLTLLENYSSLVVVLVGAASVISKIPTLSSSLIGGAQLAFSGDGSAMATFGKALNRGGHAMAAGK